MIPDVLIVISAGLFFIEIFYWIFKNRWPDIYFGTSDFTSLFISISPLRFVSFRMIPIFIAINLAISMFGSKLSINQHLIVGITIGSLHTLLHNGRALLQLIIRSGRLKRFFNVYSQYLVHIFSILSIPITGFFSGWASNSKYVGSFFPTWQGLVDNIWSSFVGAGLAVLIYKTYENRDQHPAEIFQRSLATIDDNLIDEIEIKSRQFHADKAIVLAVAIVENIQRPKWFRFLERIKSLIIRRGTYGIMQVTSTKPLNDKKSVDLAVKEYFANQRVYGEWISDERRNEVIKIAKTYNNDETYANLVADAYTYTALTDRWNEKYE